MFQNIQNLELVKNKGFSKFELGRLLQLSAAMSVSLWLVKSKIKLNLVLGIPNELDKITRIKAKIIECVDNRWDEASLIFALNWENYYNDFLKLGVKLIVINEDSKNFDKINDFFGLHLYSPHSKFRICFEL